ncbi:MAG: hypothetical protein KKD38_01755 [Candidatus Delongbacteria bacterium]|nr:hypothetical protein [Candidatus Delongbacteria bacterium]MCG2759749.1 hypothetical protein [Candidatus Delongbacteria bacterium]
MKIKTIIQLFLTAVFFLACTPDIEDDYVRIDFKKNNQYQYFDSDTLDIVFTKAIYNATLSRNEVYLDSLSYTENALLKYNGITNYKYTEYECKLSNDSNIYAVKFKSDSIYFRKIFINQSSLIYGDTLFRIDLTNSSQTDTILMFDSAQYIQILPFGNDSVANYIDSLNSIAKWYKTYRQWQDELINLYR